MDTKYSMDYGYRIEISDDDGKVVHTTEEWDDLDYVVALARGWVKAQREQRCAG
jgi:hypothetical protein